MPLRRRDESLVESMEVSPETMARIRQPLADAQYYTIIANTMWKTCITEKVSLKEFAEKKMIPRPDSLESFLRIFPAGLNAQAVNDRQVVLQFKFSGEITESCYFTIERGKIDAAGGISDIADVTIEAPFEIWMDIMTKKADNQQMLMEQKYRVSGDVSLLMQLLVPREPVGNPVS